MPIKISKYTCKFRCGTRAIADNKKMQDHEDRFCFKNPDNKTCATCVNAIYDRDGDEYRNWSYRGCKLKIMNEFLEEMQEDLTVEPSKHVKPLFHCPNHNQEEEVGITYQYIIGIRDKIKAKKKSLSDIKIGFTI